MAADVGEGLLDDPVRREVDAGGQRHGDHRRRRASPPARPHVASSTRAGTRVQPRLRLQRAGLVDCRGAWRPPCASPTAHRCRWTGWCSSARRAKAGSSSTTCSAAPACTTIMLTACATMSCSSRAMRVRSSTTAAMRLLGSRHLGLDRPAGATPGPALHAAAARTRTPHTTAKTPQWKTISPGVCSSGHEQVDVEQHRGSGRRRRRYGHPPSARVAPSRRPRWPSARTGRRTARRRAPTARTTSQMPNNGQPRGQRVHPSLGQRQPARRRPPTVVARERAVALDATRTAPRSRPRRPRRRAAASPTSNNLVSGARTALSDRPRAARPPESSRG